MTVLTSTLPSSMRPPSTSGWRVLRLRGAMAVTDETLRMGLVLVGIAVVVLLGSALWGQWRELQLNTAVQDIVWDLRRSLSGGLPLGTGDLTDMAFSESRVDTDYLKANAGTGDPYITAKGTRNGHGFTVTISQLDKSNCRAVAAHFLPTMIAHTGPNKMTVGKKAFSRTALEKEDTTTMKSVADSSCADNSSIILEY